MKQVENSTCCRKQNWVCYC